MEIWLETPILYLACRHHVYELHVKRVVQEMTGLTKDPGVPLFRRLKKEWHTLNIDYNNLTKFDYSSVPDWVGRRGELCWHGLRRNWPKIPGPALTIRNC